MMSKLMLLALLFLPPSYQSESTECTLTVTTPPYSECKDENWGPVLFRFEPGKEVKLNMPDVCNNVNKTVNTVKINDTNWIANGYLEMLQSANGPILIPRAVPKWYIESISVSCPDGVEATFGIGRYVETSRWYDFSHFDTNFEHPDCFTDQNDADLAIGRQGYSRAPAFPGGLLKLKQLTPEDIYEYNVLFSGVKADALNVTQVHFDTWLPIFMADPFFKSMDDLNNFTLTHNYGPVPEVMKYWDTDSYFEALRLQGPNPIMIKLATSIPSKFLVNTSKVESMMGKKLSDVIVEERLFIIDFDMYDAIEIYAPFGLFYVNDDGEFKVLAIQLTRGNPDDLVYYPDDPKYAWILAKMYFNQADGLYNSVLGHHGSVHVLLDNVGTLMYNYIPPSHPIYKLLKPHYYMLFGNNMAGINMLLKDGGIFDKLFAPGVKKARTLLMNYMDNVPFEQLNPLIQIINRQTENIKVYPYRDRAIPLYDAIRKYVKDVMKNHYARDNKEDDQGLIHPKDDQYLKNWRIALAKPYSCQGVFMKDLPGDDLTGEMSFHNLVDFLTTIIWQASAGHEAAHGRTSVDFPYVVNYPTALKLPPPATKDIDIDDIVARLPNKIQTVIAMNIAYLFKLDGTGGFLGHFDRQFLYAPEDLKAIEKFQDRLEVLKNEDYGSLGYPYKILNVDRIRNSPRV